MVASPFFLLSLGMIAVESPLGVVLALLPAATTLPFLLWLNRIQPEPAVARIHALLWGGVVATTLAGVVNEAAGHLFGEMVVYVVSAPLGEEALKGLAVVWAFRRGEVVRRMDAVVYALWSALGFTLVEDALYLAMAESPEAFWQVFIFRSVVPPYLHLLFSALVALSVWSAAADHRSVWGGLLVGVLFGSVPHAAWNAAVVSGTEVAVNVAWGFAAALSTLLVAGLARERKKQEARLSVLIPFVLGKYGLGGPAYGVFASASATRAQRRSLMWLERAKFDAAHNALVRLAEAHFATGTVPEAIADALVDEMIRNQVPHV